MADSTLRAGGVFLSYAREDTDAAQRIAEAMRAAGVEVWFDQSELRGGDAWDGLIRKRIKECALFVPVITANTNARAEGYFRLEWKLAVDRSHLMADDAPFLFPVVVGEVSDAAARVPDKFREVQWTRVRLDETPAELGARVARLLSGNPVEASRPRFAGPDRVSGLRGFKWWMIFPVIGTIMGLMFAAVPIWKSLNRPARREPPKIEVPAAPAKPVDPAARDWPKDPELKKAMNLTEGLEAIPDDLALAEEITKRVLDRSPTDIEAVTVMARVQAQFMRRGFDRSDERAAMAKRYAERALQLAPDEPEAMYALATYHFSRATAEAVRIEHLLRRAMELDPANPRPGRLLADLLNVTNRQAEALIQGQDNVRRFPKDVLCHYDLARNYKDQARYVEFDRELDATLALAPLPNAIVWKARLQFGLRNDFAGMKAWLDRVPPRVRGTERAVFGYFLYAAFGGDPEAGLGALRDFPQKWFTDFEYAGPTALLNASLLELEGKRELALRQYEVAQGEIQRMRQIDPARIGLSQVEFWTLLGLGRLEEAKASYRRMLEGSRRPYAQDMVNGWWFTVIPGALLIGDRATALILLRESVATLPASREGFRLRFQIDPRMAPFRDDPEIVALLAEPIAQAGPLVPKTDDKSVAVLAFANLSDDKNNEYFSDGISEELLNVLAKVPGLKVSARTSAFFFKGKEVPVPDIAKQLGVAYVVEGSVRKQGDKVRITAQLIKAADGFHVWSDTFTRDLKDIFAVQDEIAGVIAKNLQLKMGVAAIVERPVDAEAYRLVLLSRDLLQRSNTKDDVIKARQYLEEALARDPKFALAWSWLSIAHWSEAANGWGPVGPGYAAAREAAERALALAPDLSDAYSAIGLVYYGSDWDWRRAQDAFERALALAPGNASILGNLARTATTVGDNDKAVRLGRRAVELDPLNGYAQYTLCMALFQAGRFEELGRQVTQLVQLSRLGTKQEVFALLMLKRNEEALRVAEQVEGHNRTFLLALTHWGAGHKPEADKYLAQLKAEAPDSAAYQIAELYAWRGAMEEAFAWLETSYRQRDAGMIWLKNDPLLRGLHPDPRWEPLLRKMNLADDQLK